MHHDPELGRLVERLKRQQAAVVTLARQTTDADGDVDAALAHVCEVAAHTLDVERTSIWLLSRDRREMRCLELYELSRQEHSSGMVLNAVDYPRYFAALETGRAIDASDAREDLRTSEFTVGYLVPLDITSMLDAAIREEGRVIGVICHEHVGPRRTWTQDEVAFAGAVANQVALLMSNAERRRLQDDRERVRQQLLAMQRLEGLGVLAGSMAQEFSNLLILIMGNATVARQAVGLEHAASEPLGEILAVAGRAATLTRQLLTYSGRGRVVAMPLDVSVHVGELTEIIASSCPKRVRVRFDLAHEPWAIKADGHQVQQCVMNLVINGIEAIGNREGEVRVTTANRFLSVEDIAALRFGKGVMPGRYVMVQVVDTGRGVEPDALDRMFDPFFSTKGPGRGLGLSAVLGIVRKHRGAIDVVTTPDAGTTCRLYFPATDIRVDSVTMTLRPELRGSGALLVMVEDEPIGQAIRKSLEPYGYTILAPRGPDEALAMTKERPGEVRALLLDMAVTPAAIRELAEVLRRGEPNLRILLMTSFDGRDAARELVEAGVADIVHKPFSPETLARKLRELLARA